jgi:hypothetical protein
VREESSRALGIARKGVGPGYYWFGAGFLLFIAAGTVKAYYDDKKWNGKVIKMMSKKGRKNVVDATTMVVRNSGGKDKEGIDTKL